MFSEAYRIVFEEEHFTDWGVSVGDESESPTDDYEPRVDDSSSTGDSGSEAGTETISTFEHHIDVENYELQSIIKIEHSTDHFIDPENDQNDPTVAELSKTFMPNASLTQDSYAQSGHEISNERLVELERSADFIKRPLNKTLIVSNTCDNTFPLSDNFENYIRKHFLIEQQQSNSCDICKRGFLGLHDLIGHLKAEHSLKKLYQCALCVKKFVRQSDLAKHLRTHAEKPFSCEFCNRKFILACNLKMHLQSHVPASHANE